MRKSAFLRWSGYIAFAIVFAIACGFLANWQFERNEYRSASNDLIATNYDAAPIPLSDALDDGRFDPAEEWQSVLLEGEYLPDDQVLVRGRPRGGTSAFEVLVPFRTTEGTVLLIDRGWVAPDESSNPETVPAPPSGTVEVIARLRPEEPAPTSGRSAPPGQVPTLNIGLVEAQTSTALLPGAYALMASETPAPATTPHPLPKPEQEPGPHLSYAIQWILFALMGFVFIGYMIRTELRARKEDAQREEGTYVPRARPRRDRDSAEEDELLDATS